MRDVQAWASYGGVTGIFYDDIGQTRPDTTTKAQQDSFVAFARYASNLVATYPGLDYQHANPHIPGASMFNLGSSHGWMDEYVNCTTNYNTQNYYVIVENSYSVVTGIPDLVDAQGHVTGDTNYRWLLDYSLQRFAVLIYGDGTNPTSGTVRAAWTKAANLNAMLVYVTDRTFSNNPWGDLATYPVYNAEDNVSWDQQTGFNGESATFPGGFGDKAQYPTCPYYGYGAPCCPTASSTEL
jgi:hypothetical protein